MQNPLIIIVGLPGSGKSFAGQVLKKRFNAQVVETGDIIREEIKRRGWKLGPETDKKIRNWFHSGREHLVVKRLWDKIKDSRKKVRVIVGFRCWKEVLILKKYYKGKIILISLKSSFKTRVEREHKRKRFGKSESLSYLRDRDTNEKRIGVDALMKKADYSLNNSNLTKKQTETKLVNLMKKIIE